MKNKIKLAALTLSTTMMMAVPAFATGVETQVKDLVNKGIDLVFNLLGGGITFIGVIMLIMAGFGFFKGMTNRDAEQQRESGNSLGIALLIIVLGALVFVLKNPISGLVTSMMTV